MMSKRIACDPKHCGSRGEYSVLKLLNIGTIYSEFCFPRNKNNGEVSDAIPAGGIGWDAGRGVW
jgi:hypothetical protein